MSLESGGITFDICEQNGRSLGHGYDGCKNTLSYLEAKKEAMRKALEEYMCSTNFTQLTNEMYSTVNLTFKFQVLTEMPR